MRSLGVVCCLLLVQSAASFASAKPLALKRPARAASPILSLGEAVSGLDAIPVLDRVTNAVALFGLPTYESARPGGAGLNTFAGHENDLFLIAILVVIFPTAVTILLTQNRD